MDERKLRTILNKVIKVSDKHQKIREKNGGDFNIFSILRKENDEVHLHSKFIYELLNPSGSHHQGKLFLDLFVSEALDIENYNKASLEVFREAPTEHGRRIDFLIESNDYIIGIEMKIDAGDQNEQLLDYYNELKKQSKKRKIKLIYLTKFGDNPSNKSISNFDLKKVTNKSFVLDIDWWLDKCIYKTKNVPKLNELIIQYKALVEKITGKITDEMGHEMNEIVKSVKDIEAMNTLVNYYPRIWAQKEVDFWDELHSRVNNMMINGQQNSQNKNISIELCGTKNDSYNNYKYDISYDVKIDILKQDRHHMHISKFGMKIQVKYKKYTFDIWCYKRDDGYSNIEITLFGARGGIDSKKNNNLKDLLINLNFFDTSGDKEFLPKLTFYAKNIMEPSFDLFDEDKVREYLKEATKEIKKLLQIIEDNKDDMIS